MKIVLALVLVLHGAIHLLGAAKGLRLAVLPQLTQPISPAFGVVWLVAGALFMASAGLVFAWPRGWWLAAAVALVFSTVAIVPSWADAKFGAAVNALVLVAVAYGFLVSGPVSLRAEYDRDVAARRGSVPPAAPVTESDLATLPAPVQRFLRRAGVVGQPRVARFYARMHGRIRSGAADPWMPFTAEQHNFYDRPSRFFYMTASRAFVPFQVFHRYADDEASMRVKVAGLVTVQELAGDAMTRAETVTLFNDMCLFAPATVLSPAVVWEAIDDRTARAVFSNAGQSIRAELDFNDAGELVNFRSDDRGRTSTDGRALEPVPWSTPLGAYRAFGALRLPSQGEARWHDTSGDYAYIEMTIDEVRVE